MEELMARIEEHSVWEPNSGCRLWTGGVSRDHGMIKWHGKMEAVHRVAWEYANGRSIPKGLWVLHRCGISVCSNPAHLYLGTRLQNAADRRRHGGYRGFQAADPIRIVNAPFKRAAPSNKEGIPSVEELRRMLAYDRVSGDFRWLHREDRERDWNTRFAGKIAGQILGNGYRYIMLGKKPRLAHRLAWLYMTGEWPTHQIDHINRDRADNRWDNLRAATNQQNQNNTGLRSTNKSGVKGVNYVAKKHRWQAMITVDYKQRFLGYFMTKDDAIAARLKAEQERDAAA